MRRLNRILLALSIAVIAVGFAACSKTPTEPTTTTPPITPPTRSKVPSLEVDGPHSCRWGDSTVLSVHCSSPLDSSWIFLWSFGDSQKVMTKDSTLIHAYLKAGSFTVVVSIVNSSTVGLVASRTGTIQVIPLRFDLLKLATMNHVTVECQGKLIAPWPSSGPQILSTQALLTWSGSNFTEDTSGSQTDSNLHSTYGLEVRKSDRTESAGGTIDTALFSLANFFMRSAGHSSTEYPTDYGESSVSAWSENIGVSNVPCRSQSDSQIVFEARGAFLHDPVYNTDEQVTSHVRGTTNTNTHIDWSDASVYRRITIRFSK